MSEEARLHLNPRWKLGDIVDVIERTQGEKPRIVSHHDIAPGYFCFEFKGRSLDVHTQTQLPTGVVTLLSLHNNPEGIRILRDIAGTLGGILEERAGDLQCEIIDGNMNDEDGLAFFLKYAIVHDGIDGDDIGGLVESTKEMRKWLGRYRTG